MPTDSQIKFKKEVGVTKQMTTRDLVYKAQLIRALRKEGHGPYADYLRGCVLHLSETGTAAMMPGTKPLEIYMNIGLFEETFRYASHAVRHEILHDVLGHTNRAINVYSARNGVDPKTIKEEDLETIFKEMRTSGKTSMKLPKWNNQVVPADNAAGDFDLNQFYMTDEDRQIAANLKIGTQMVHGLLINEHFPELEGKSFEFIYNKFLEDSKSDTDLDNPMTPPEQPDNIDDGGEGGNSSGEGSDDGSSSDGGGMSGDGEKTPGGGNPQGGKDTSGEEEHSKSNGGNASGEGSDDDGPTSDGGGSSKGSGDDEGDPSDSSGGDDEVIYGTFRDGKFYDEEGNEL